MLSVVLRSDMKWNYHLAAAENNRDTCAKNTFKRRARTNPLLNPCICHKASMEGSRKFLAKPLFQAVLRNSVLFRCIHHGRLTSACEQCGADPLDHQTSLGQTRPIALEPHEHARWHGLHLRQPKPTLPEPLESPRGNNAQGSAEHARLRHSPSSGDKTRT